MNYGNYIMLTKNRESKWYCIMKNLSKKKNNNKQILFYNENTFYKSINYDDIDDLIFIVINYKNEIFNNILMIINHLNNIDILNNKYTNINYDKHLFDIIDSNVNLISIKQITIKNKTIKNKIDSSIDKYNKYNTITCERVEFNDISFIITLNVEKKFIDVYKLSDIKTFSFNILNPFINI